MPLPVAHGLLGAAIVATTRKNFSFRKDWLALLLGAALAVIPDLEVCRYEMVIFMPVLMIVVWLKRWQDRRETQERVKA